MPRRSSREDYERAERQDEELRSKVEAAINRDKGMRGYDINVRVQDGIVHLEGIVDVLREKQRAQEIAFAVSGVKDVENNLTVSTDGGITDGDVEFEIAEELRAHGVDPKNVWATVESGVAHVRGKAASQGEAKAAVEAVTKARGVKDVVDEMKVMNDADTPAVTEKDRAAASSPITDLIGAIQSNPFIAELPISVTQVDGTIRIEGEVETLEQKRAVEQAIDLTVKENPRARVRIDNRIIVDTR